MKRPTSTRYRQFGGGFFYADGLIFEVLNMRMINVIGLTGMLLMSTSALAEGGGDRAFERMMSANTESMAQYAASQGKRAPVVKAFEYGMTLDVVRVVSVVRPQKACAAVPAAMTYEDSQGQLNTVRYTVAGDCRVRGG